ncbi:DUF1552 domain-containing protein [bacterium]|nr:DUF1552 domain-containing protein [Akkermansiaceae bacterium]MDB4466421.1 DUF1552 domain-containing protein [bacterium]MDB4382935.1 DUF1552 domain-containing protein [Akkermansiaceae bacterium]MDB4465106.1 DUF1552 domain-containing protein [Akkermansiaceae bacterium]MDB4488762.1 DUF1552 domain-containing protein [Akkermansiaceae bacterium]
MKQYRRREFLKFGVALPLALHSLNARAASAPGVKAPPKRVIFICNSLGFYEPNFFPTKRGDLSTSKYLKEMAVREKMTVFQNFFHPGMETSNHDSEKSFLTGAPSPEATNFTNTISLDQILAREMGGDTRFPYLSFSIYDRGWGCSWNDRGVAIPPMHDERQIFERLFGEEDLSAKRQQIENDQQIVKSLYRDMEQIKKKGGDASKIESYRTVISELEAQLKHEEFWLKTKKPEVPDTLSNDREFAFSTKVRNLLELSKLAFQTDSTRVITLSLDWIYGAITVPGATGGWHTLSHHGGKADALAKLSRIELDIVRNLNRFLSDLDGIKEGKGTLLDHTTVMIGSNFGDSSNHICKNLPTIVAGGGYRHRGHSVLEKPTPLCNLFLDLLHAHDMDQESFGSSEESLGLLS